MNSKNKFVYLDKLTKSINFIHHKLIYEIFSTDSITVIYNELLPSLPTDVLTNLYLNIKNNLYLFSPEQIEKLKPVVTFYTNIKFPCSTQCNPVNNPNRLSLQDKEYGTKKDCLLNCNKKVSINDDSLLLTMSFLSFEDKLKYLIGINRKELISKIQERDIYNPEIIIKQSSPLEKEYRPYVIITLKSHYEKNPKEYENVKFLYETHHSIEDTEYDVVRNINTQRDIIISITHTANQFSLVLNDKPLTKKQTKHVRKLKLENINHPLGDILSTLTHLKELEFGPEFNQPLGDSLLKLTQLEKLKFQSLDQNLGDSLSTLTHLKELDLGTDYYEPIGDSLSTLTLLKKLNLGDFNHPLGDSLSKLTQLKKLNFSQFNHPLGDSLSNLTKLKELNLGYIFNYPLGDSLSKLTKLTKLNLGYKFNQPLGDGLSKLTKLKELNLGYGFNQPLGDSLSTLTQLKKLIFETEFNQPLGDSLSNLIQLKELVLGNAFKMPLGDSLLKLTKLERLNYEKFDNVKKFFSFKYKNSKKELRKINLHVLKQHIKDLQKEGYEIHVYPKIKLI